MLELAGEKEIARVTADENGNYRVALPLENYVLDVQDRERRRHSRKTRNLSRLRQIRPCA
jgi:hypothetical protein